MAEFETVEVPVDDKWAFRFTEEQVHYLGCLLRYAQATHFAKSRSARKLSTLDFDMVGHDHGARMAGDLLKELVDVVGEEDAGKLTYPGSEPS